MFLLEKDLGNGRSQVIGVFSTEEMAKSAIKRVQLKYGREDDLRFEYGWYELAWTAHHRELVDIKLDALRREGGFGFYSRVMDVWSWSGMQSPSSFENWAWFTHDRPPTHLFCVSPVKLNEIVE